MKCLSEGCEAKVYEADLCRKHYREGIKAGTSLPCGVCPGQLWATRNTPARVFDRTVVRLRQCSQCKRTQVTVEVMLSTKQLARTGEAMLGDYFGRMHADSVTTAPPDTGAPVASTGRTTAEGSAS